MNTMKKRYWIIMKNKTAVGGVAVEIKNADELKKQRSIRSGKYAEVFYTQQVNPKDIVFDDEEIKTK